MENIIEKLNQVNDDDIFFKNWSLEERKKLLDMYFIISKKESHIFYLIYRYHGCDSWEDIFRDYSEIYLEDKACGVEVAIEEITKEIEQKKNK